MDILCDAIGFTQTSTGPEHPNSIDHRRSVSSVPSGPQSTSPQGSSRKCHLCGRSYERADHLNRHLKSHENARSHKCTRCNKSFNRADLLNRHEAGHDRPPTERRSIERGNRVAAACLACVQARTKCQDQKPCIRCLRRKIPCETSGNDTQLNDGSATSNLQSTWDGQAVGGLIETQEHGPLSNLADGQNTAGVPGLYDGNSISRDAVLDPALAIQSGSPNNMQYDMQQSGSTYYDEPPPSSSLLTSFLGHQHITSLPGERQFGNTYFSQDLDFGMWDFDVDSVELGLGDYNPSSGGNDMHQTPNSSSHPPKDASKRYAAFERSPWLWTPTKSDQALNDQHDLNIDEDSIPSVLTPASPASSIDEFTKCCIHQKERDKLLSIMFTLQKTSSNPPLLPSLALLNNIIHVYFVQESFKVDQLIHVGTFEPSKVLPHVLLAIISAGSSLISTPAIWKMGLALQEVVRHTVAEYWEQDNSHTRNLQAVQAFMIMLDVGLWSGFKRKMELAESFAQPITIMLRRAGAFAAPDQQSLEPHLWDSEATLDSKWRKWVERESFKRLVLHLFIHDIQASIGLQKPPLISINELKFQLPASRNLWLAKSPTEWRDRYLSSRSKLPVPSLVDALHCTTLESFSSQADIQLTAISLLHGHWGQILSLNESKKFFPSSKSAHRLWLHTAYTELYQDLATFSLHLPSMTNNSTEATLVAELLLMTLHISPEDLHRFAGKFGEDETRKATEDFAAWAKTKEARIAVWHAGQVFRAAKSLMPAQNRAFNAIALYYATLTLWVYGHMISDVETPPSPNTQAVIINESETPQSTLFRASSQGVPFLSEETNEGKTLVLLAEPDKILHIARDIYRQNYPLLEERLPPLVENLSILLKDLGSLPGSRISRAPSEGV